MSFSVVAVLEPGGFPGFFNKAMADKRVKEQLKKQSNLTCFDCGVKGSQYAVLDMSSSHPFGVYVCQSCAGIQ